MLELRKQWKRFLQIAGAVMMVVGCTTAHAQSAGLPNLLPAQPFDYVSYVNNVPAHFADEIARDSTPTDNPLTNAGATLGRVLFYDKRLSHNNSMSCSSCHFQENGFSQPTATSLQVDGNQTTRHSMALTNVQFFGDGFLSGRTLSDVSAPTLEAQTLLPIVTSELGIGALGSGNLDVVIAKLQQSTFYNELFLDAFGQPADPQEGVITTERLTQALAQFVRSTVSYDSKFDQIFDANGNEDSALVAAVLTTQEQLGKDLFHGRGNCADCHQGNSQTTLQVHNNGLDATTSDPGAGNGLFKAASLRNIEVRGRFMHDGRFSTLEEVVEFYNSEVQDHPDLDFRLREGQILGNGPATLDFTQQESDALVAFLKTLTDDGFLTDAKFSDPFVLSCDFDANEICDIDDLDQLLASGPIAGSVTADATNAMYDLNGDGVIDTDDSLLWREIAADANGLSIAYEAGDANLDGIVDDDDFLVWNNHRFSTETAWSRGDFNGDGAVDVSDFNIWNTHRDPASSTQQVPEPHLAMWMILLLGLFATRRRAY